MTAIPTGIIRMLKFWLWIMGISVLSALQHQKSHIELSDLRQNQFWERDP